MLRGIGSNVCRLLGFGVVLLSAATLTADVRTPAVFGSGMVLQQGKPVPVWGWADPGEKITVSFRDQLLEAQANSDGKWSVKLSPLSLGEPGTLKIKGKNEITFSDVLVGEVWVCSGQSNMGWTVFASIDPDVEVLSASYPNIRLFKVPLLTAAEPQADVKAEWTHCTPETIPSFSGVAYFFGRNVHQVTGVPVGLIQTAWGGTRAEAWTSPEMMAKKTELKPIVDTWAKRATDYNPEAAQESYKVALAKWETQAKAAQEAGKPAPRRPEAPTDPRMHRDGPSTIYNAMVAPLAPFAIQGAIWYQGESNANRAYQYRTLMPALIQSWRDLWQQGDFPFHQVQLANFKAVQPEPGDSDWAELREAQTLTIDAIPNVGVACITDIGAALDIHPKNKHDVGRRLARIALVDQYGYGGKIVRNGPTYRSLDINGGKCLVHFDVGNAPLISWYNEPLKGFAIAGADKKWHWADAKIVGKDTIEVSSKNVSEPAAVRYNWADNPQGNLYNSFYLPAYPFRSDDWPGVTVNNVNP